MGTVTNPLERERKGCKACRRPIVFVTTTTGGKMPCEAEPVDPVDVKAGQMVVNDDGRTFRFDPEDVLHTEQERLWIPHWENCSGAEKFRK